MGFESASYLSRRYPFCLVWVNRSGCRPRIRETKQATRRFAPATLLQSLSATHKMSSVATASAAVARGLR